MGWKIFAICMVLANCVGLISMAIGNSQATQLDYIGSFFGPVAAVFLLFYSFNILAFDIKVLQITNKIMSLYFVFEFLRIVWKSYALFQALHPAYVISAIAITILINGAMWLAVNRYCRGLTVGARPSSEPVGLTSWNSKGTK